MSDKRAVIEYTTEQRDSLLKALDDIHPNPHDDEKQTEQVYVVMAFTEYEDGIAGSLGVFGSDGIGKMSGIVEDAKRLKDTGMATIAAAIASKEIEPKLDEWTMAAQGVKLGARFFYEDHMKKADPAEAMKRQMAEGAE